MTQPDNPRHAPMNDHRQILISAAPCKQFASRREVYSRRCIRLLASFVDAIHAICLLAQRLSGGVASTPSTVARKRMRRTGLGSKLAEAIPARGAGGHRPRPL